MAPVDINSDEAVHGVDYTVAAEPMIQTNSDGTQIIVLRMTRVPFLPLDQAPPHTLEQCAKPG